MKFIAKLKKIPFIDVGQAERKHDSAGKRIAWSYVPPDGQGKVAVDIGCRDGFWSEKLKEQGYRVHALDLEPSYHDAIRHDVETGLPVPDKSVDLIWCTEVVEHLSDPTRLFVDIERVLRLDGVAVLTTPNSAWWIYPVIRLAGLTPAMVQNPSHKHFFSFHDIVKLARGYEVLGFFPYVSRAFPIRRGAGLLSPTFTLVKKF